MPTLRKILSWFSLVLGCVWAVNRPPGIFLQPDYNVYYKVGETVELPCAAEGTPKPIYTWTRNGIDFVPAGNDDRVVQLVNVGTLVITKPENKDEGIFQCSATNNYGRSLSITVNLREAKLKDFEVRPSVTVYPQLGDSLTLNCIPPESIPPAQVFWVIKRPTGGFDAVNYDARVNIGPEYRLRFTNVIRSDFQNGRAYACMAMNKIMRKTTQGPQYFIVPQGSTEEFHPTQYLWASIDDHLGLRNKQFRVKCIFSGNPTPDVHWERTDGSPLPNRAKIASFGQELIINDLQFDDEGIYECWATNVYTSTRVQRTVNLRVESSPYWVIEPQDVEIGINGTAEFNCLANARPEPEYFWFVNGIRLEDVRDSRITAARFKRPRPDRIIFTGVQRDDAMVIQCNATNKHGYVWGDAYLNVLSEAPTIIIPPEPQKVVAEGTSISLTCHVAGKPDPIITWYKGKDQITGGRYKIKINGDLHINNVVLADAGTYMCEARNVFNTTSASGILLVRQKTRIELAPQDIEVNAGTEVKFTCSGTTDPEEVKRLQIMWFKDNKKISTSVQRITTNQQDNSLAISGTIVRDSGTYKCVITNGLDTAQASAMLVVRDRPDSPTKVRIEKCKDRNATIVWMPGSYNNAPVQYFIIQFNTFSPDAWRFAKKVDSIYSSANISLSPWVNYTYRVIAYNKIGESDPSLPTAEVCTSNADHPESHPQNLRTVGNIPNFLHIQWTPMPPIEQNGPGFQYILQFKREGQPESTVQRIPINTWSTSFYKYSTPNQLYEPYQITLRARNMLGEAQQDPPTIRGFTGESVPTIVPTNLRVEDVKDTVVTLAWEFSYAELNKTPNNIHGEFRGFKIWFWQQSYKMNTFCEKDVSLEDALKSRVGDTFSAIVENLLPFTNMEIQVAVMNNFFVSRPTDAIHFKTTIGFPSPVELFRPINIGDNHVHLEWMTPEGNPGDIIGYDIGYQLVKGLDLGEMKEREPQINDPYTTTAMLSGLLSNHRYRIHIWARTIQGRGEDFFIELTTTQTGDVQAPSFTITDVGMNYINVSWWINPYVKSGTVVHIQYRKEGAAEWLQTTDEVISSWKNISGLESGSLYEVRIIAPTEGLYSASHIEVVRTKGISMAWALVGNYGWFTGMTVSLALFGILIIVFIILFRQGKHFRLLGSTTDTICSEDDAVFYKEPSHGSQQSKGLGPESQGYNRDYWEYKSCGDICIDQDDHTQDKQKKIGYQNQAYTYNNSDINDDDDVSSDCEAYSPVRKIGYHNYAYTYNNSDFNDDDINNDCEAHSSDRKTRYHNHAHNYNNSNANDDDISSDCEAHSSDRKIRYHNHAHNYNNSNANDDDISSDFEAHTSDRKIRHHNHAYIHNSCDNISDTDYNQMVVRAVHDNYYDGRLYNGKSPHHFEKCTEHDCSQLNDGTWEDYQLSSPRV